MSIVEAKPVSPKPAATVVVVREKLDRIEVLLLLRDSNLAFSAGNWVFPGGKIESLDYGHDPGALEYHAAVRAAVRETREEAGIDLDHQQLIHTAHWTTPEHLPIRFSTWFFLCPVYQELDVVVDDCEIRDFRWISPARALQEIADRGLSVLQPTRVTLQDLQHCCSLDEVLEEVSVAAVRVFPDGSPHYKPIDSGADDVSSS